MSDVTSKTFSRAADLKAATGKKETITPAFTSKAYTIFKDTSKSLWVLLEVEVDPVNNLTGEIKRLTEEIDRSGVIERFKIAVATNLMGD